MKRKTQITFFVLLGFFAIIIIMFLIYGFSISWEKIKGIKQAQTSQTENAIANIKSDILNCMETAAKESCYFIGRQAGYSQLLTRGIFIGDMRIGIVYENNKSRFPSLESIEESISKYVSERVTNCIAEENYLGYKIDYITAKTSTIIDDDFVRIKTIPKIRLIKDDQLTIINDALETSINWRFGALYSASKRIIGKQVQNPEEICFSCILDIMKEFNLTGDIQTYEDKLIIFLTDKSSKLNKENLQFILGLKFNRS